MGRAIAWVFSATQYDIIVVAPLTKPAAPTPEMALPTMRVIELGATAEMTDPASKMTSMMQYVHLIL